ncbi:MAG: universal stress protein [Xanthobacteraceae bacterium]|jgi:nucleotide-binding universal stress UspA family protein
MIKLILVPVGGSESDPVVFETARGVAQPFAAHLDFFHVRVGVGEAAEHTPYMEFARGEALRNTMNLLSEEARHRSVDGERHVRDFCDQWRIPIVEIPAPGATVSASYTEESGHAPERLIEHARHSDLVVMARSTRANGLPHDLLESVLRQTGRPVLLTATGQPVRLTGTMMVCWKDAPEPARALAAALPLLGQAERVVVVTVDEHGAAAAHGPEGVVRHLAWHGIRADALVVPASGRSTAEALESAAQGCGAGLLVMGCYGQGRAHEILFGSSTQAIMAKAELPIFLLH